MHLSRLGISATQCGMSSPIAHGLEGVVVAETRLSHVDGNAGELLISGHSVESLAGVRPFEEVAAMLWNM